MAVHEYRPAAPKKTKAPPFPFPWGLLVVLAIYVAGVYGYVWKTYWESPDYQAAQHYAKALTLLGVDDGRRSPPAELEAAFGHVLEAAVLVPENHFLAQHTERLRWRFEERGLKLNADYARKAELVSKSAQRIEEERSPWLVVGARDKGWAPDQLLAGPERVLWWSLPGFVLIIAFWGYGQFNSRGARERDHEANLRAAEAEAAELGRWREGLKNRDEVPDDEDTIRTPRAPSGPTRRPSGTNTPRRPSSTNQPAARKKPGGTS